MLGLMYRSTDHTTITRSMHSQACGFSVPGRGGLA